MGSSVPPVLTLARSGKEIGLPEEDSTVPATALKLADLAGAAAPAATNLPTALAPKQAAKAAVTKTTKVAVKKTVAARANKLPQHRPPAFVVAGVRREPLDEIPLTNRAALLLRWVQMHPKPTNANVKHWLYQHAWIVDGAEMGWWHGAAALHELVTVDQRVWKLWGIGDLSESVARRALADVEARSS